MVSHDLVSARGVSYRDVCFRANYVVTEYLEMRRVRSGIGVVSCRAASCHDHDHDYDYDRDHGHDQSPEASSPYVARKRKELGFCQAEFG